MLETSPLRRAEEQPPCDAHAEALALNGMFAVPERLQVYDLRPHLYFPEHREIWQAMTSVHGGDPEQLWFRTLQQLRGRHGIDKARRLLGILEVTPFMSVGRSDKGCMVFMLAYVKLQRCTAARREISLAQERVRVLWRVPGTPYTEFEKHSLFGPVYVDVDE